MTNRKSSSNGAGRAGKPRGAKQSSVSGTRIRVEPTRRKRVDPDMIALCYWLIAQRIVEQADDDGAQAGSSPTADSDDAPSNQTSPRSVA